MALNPWGRITNRPTIPRPRLAHTKSSIARGNPNSALYSMPITGSGPAHWWIEGQKRRSPTAPTVDSAARHNKIVQRAFDRPRYPID